MIETMQGLARGAAEAGRAWARGIVQGVSGTRASVRLDGETVNRPGIPIAGGLSLSAGDYVLLARLDAQNLLVLAKIPV